MSLFDAPSPPPVTVPPPVDQQAAEADMLADIKRRKQEEASRRGIDSLRIDPAQPVSTGIQVR